MTDESLWLVRWETRHYSWAVAHRTRVKAEALALQHWNDSVPAHGRVKTFAELAEQHSASVVRIYPNWREQQ